MKLLLILLGSPLWLPLLIAAFAVLLALYLSLWTVVISLWVILAALVTSALAGLCYGIGCAVLIRPTVGLACIGVGIACAGVSLALLLGCRSASRAMLLPMRRLSLRRGRRLYRV